VVLRLQKAVTAHKQATCKGFLWACSPTTEHILYGGELQWGRRKNHSDGFRSNDYRIQFSFKFNFAAFYRRHAMNRKVLVRAVFVLIASGALVVIAAPTADIQAALDAAYAKYKSLNEGKNADYIPALAKVDPNLFGIAVVTVDGKTYMEGDTKSEVSIQSISKVFTLANVIKESGVAAVRDNIGVDATGQVFNSIQAIEQYKGKEMNPLVNPGAIATTSMVKGANADEVWAKIIGTYSDFAGRPLTVNQEVYKSESATNQRNQAIAALMYAYGRIKSNPQQATDLYTRQCSVNVNAKDLATMAGTLANGGRNPVTGKQLLTPNEVAHVLAVMATAGLYDDSGKWIFATGLPGKSGVGGGLIAVSPGKFGIAAISPPLDEAGNSVRAQRAITDVSNALHGNPYLFEPSPHKAN
jgi:glutaminase